MCVLEGCEWDAWGWAGNRSLMGWFCDLRNDCGDPRRVKLVLPDVLEGCGLCLMLGGGGVVSRGDGMCWRWQEGLLVRGDVSVGFGLSRLPWGGGMRGVRDGGDAMRQGS